VGLSLGDGGEELGEALHAPRLGQILRSAHVDETVLAFDDALLGEVVATDVESQDEVEPWAFVSVALLAMGLTDARRDTRELDGGEHRREEGGGRYIFAILPVGGEHVDVGDGDGALVVLLHLVIRIGGVPEHVLDW
jgi:hypothetical protein